MEKGNIAIRKVNVLKCARRAAGQSGEELMSDDEKELALPVLADFMSMFAPGPVVLPEPGADDHMSPGAGKGEIYGSPYLEEMGADEHQEWDEGVSPSAANDANVARSRVVDYQTLGHIYTEEQARKNALTLKPQGIPNAILQMVHGRVYIPLSMLTTAALNHVRTNDNLQYVKVPNSIIKQTLNPAQFGAEDDMSTNDWDQAYRNWILLLKIITDPGIVAGWVDHRENMRAEEDWNRWSCTWRKMDKQLQMHFTTDPFVVDPTSSAYLHAFEWARMDIQADLTYLQFDNHPRPRDRSRRSSLPDNRFQPYSDVCFTN